MTRQTLAIEINDVSAHYDKKLILHNVTLSQEQGEIGCLLGPSGCGKTTLLRAIAGLEKISHGSISVNGRVFSSNNIHLKTEERNVGMVFQDFALFPHLTIAENVGFGLRDWSAPDRNARINELLQLVKLEAHSEKYPHQISGGQQQRVALIRAMAPRPQLLLLDEPFSSLDSSLREELARDIREILKKDHCTALLVTHDHHEAFAMADRIAVIDQGVLQQWDTPYAIYHQPSTQFVAEFVGKSALIEGTVESDQRVRTTLGLFTPINKERLTPGNAVKLLLRPDDVIHDDLSELKFEIVDRAFRGSEYLYTLTVDDNQQIYCLVQSHHNHAIGEYLRIYFDMDDVVVFEKKIQA